MFRLMIKTHRTTGYKYLCVTTKEDYEGYCGSGVRWRKHLQAHGFDVATEVLFEHHSRDDIFKHVCLYYSDVYDVVNSDEWANLILEDGNTGYAFQKWDDRDKFIRSAKYKEMFADPIIGKLWRYKIGLASAATWSRHSMSDRTNRINNIKNAYTEEKRAEHSATLKRYHENMSTEEKLAKGAALSNAYQSKDPEWKAARGNKISNSLQESDAFASYVDTMKEARVGGGNPAARIVHWDGMVFDTCAAFYAYIRENKIISKNAAERILKNNPTEARYIASKKTGEKLYENRSN